MKRRVTSLRLRASLVIGMIAALASLSPAQVDKTSTPHRSGPPPVVDEAAEDTTGMARGIGAASTAPSQPRQSDTKSPAKAPVSPTASESVSGFGTKWAHTFVRSIGRWTFLDAGDSVSFEVPEHSVYAMVAFSGPRDVSTPNLAEGIELVHIGPIARSTRNVDLHGAAMSVQDLEALYWSDRDGFVAWITGRSTFLISDPTTGAATLILAGAPQGQWILGSAPSDVPANAPSGVDAWANLTATVYGINLSQLLSVASAGSACLCVDIIDLVLDGAFDLACQYLTCYKLPVFVCSLLLLAPDPISTTVALYACGAGFTAWMEICDHLCTAAGAIWVDAFTENFASSLCAMVPASLGGCSDDVPPVATILHPTSGSVGAGTFHVDALVSPDVSTVAWVEFEYSTTGGSPWLDVVGPGSAGGTVIFEGQGGILFDTVAAGIGKSHSMRVRVRAADSAGNTSDWFVSDPFTVDNGVDSPQEIGVSASLSPTVADPFEAVYVWGNAEYDSGSVVPLGTVTLSLGSSTWTTPVASNGSFGTYITAPGNTSSSQQTHTLLITVSDGLVEGSASLTLKVAGTSGTPPSFDLGACVTCEGVSGSSPYDPIGITSCFDTSEPELYAWMELLDVQTAVQARFEFYDPTGDLFGTVTTDAIGPGPYDWVKFWAWWQLSGTILADIEGRWSVRFLVDSGSGFQHVSTREFSIGYDFLAHQMAKDVQGGVPIAPTSQFFTSDNEAHTWMELDLVGQGLDIRWDWYEPNGSLYGSAETSTDPPPPGSCYLVDAWSWIAIDGSAAVTKTGDWHINVLIQDAFGNWETQYVDVFRIDETGDTGPTLLVSAPSSPMEGETVDIGITASDAGYIDDVTLWWEGAATGSQTWSTVNANLLSQTHALPALGASQTIKVHATATDNSGNASITAKETVTFQDDDVEGPTITAVSVHEYQGDGNGIIDHTEEVEFTWTASDPKGTGEATLFVDDNSHAASGSGSYATVIGPLTPGSHEYVIYVEDADDEPTASLVSGTFDVVDATPPSGPFDLDSASHTLSAPSCDTTVTMTWTAATAPAGIGGYIDAWDHEPLTVPFGTTTLPSAAIGSTATLAASSTAWYYHIRAASSTGSLGLPQHFGPVLIVDPASAVPTWDASLDGVPSSFTCGTPPLPAASLNIANTTDPLCAADVPWTVTVSPASATWIQPSVIQGSVAAGDTQTLSVTLNTSSLPVGLHEAALQIASPAANPDAIDLPVVIDVLGEPAQLSLTGDAPTLVATPQAPQPSITVPLTAGDEPCTGPVTFTVDPDSVPAWLQVSPMTATLQPGDSVPLELHVLEAGQPALDAMLVVSTPTQLLEIPVCVETVSADAVVLGPGTWHGQLSSPGEKDWAAIDAFTGEKVNIRIRGTQGGPSTFSVDVRDATGLSLGDVAVKPTKSGAEVVWTATSPGRVYVGLASAAEAGSYKARIQRKAVGKGHSISKTAQYGPNEPITLHLHPGSRISGRLGTKSQPIVDSTGVLVELLDPNGEPLALPDANASGVIRLKSLGKPWQPSAGFEFGDYTLQPATGGAAFLHKIRILPPPKKKFFE